MVDTKKLTGDELLSGLGYVQEQLFAVQEQAERYIIQVMNGLRQSYENAEIRDEIRRAGDKISSSMPSRIDGRIDGHVNVRIKH